MQIDIADIIHDPFDFDVIDEDAGGHVEVMDNFVGHEVYVLSGFADHQLLAKVLVGLAVFVACLEFAYSADENENFSLCSVIEILID